MCRSWLGAPLRKSKLPTAHLEGKGLLDFNAISCKHKAEDGHKTFHGMEWGVRCRWYPKPRVRRHWRKTFTAQVHIVDIYFSDSREVRCNVLMHFWLMTVKLILQHDPSSTDRKRQRRQAAARFQCYELFHRARSWDCLITQKNTFSFNHNLSSSLFFFFLLDRESDDKKLHFSRWIQLHISYQMNRSLIRRRAPQLQFRKRKLTTNRLDELARKLADDWSFYVCFDDGKSLKSICLSRLKLTSFAACFGFHVSRDAGAFKKANLSQTILRKKKETFIDATWDKVANMKWSWC